MANFIVFLILCFIAMLSSKNPIVSIIGIVILIFVLSGFNTAVFLIAFLIIVCVVVYSIYDNSQKEVKRRIKKEGLNKKEIISDERKQNKNNTIICENCYEENEITRISCKKCGAKLYKNSELYEESKRIIEQQQEILIKENQIADETNKEKNTTSKNGISYRMNEIKENRIENHINEMNHNYKVVKHLINDRIILQEFVYCCYLFNEIEEPKIKDIKLEESLIKMINNIFIKYKYELQIMDSKIYDKKSFMNKQFSNILKIKSTLEDCLSIKINDLKENDIFIHTLMQEIHFCDIFKVANIIRIYKNNYSIWSTNEKNENFYVLIYFCSYIFASCLYEKTENSHMQEEKKYIIKYNEYLKMKKIDKENVSDRKDVIIIFYIEKSQFEKKDTNSKLDYLVKKANNIRIHLENNEKYSIMRNENKFDKIGAIQLEKIIEIMVNSLKYYDLQNNANLVLLNIIQIFNKTNELQKEEKEKDQNKEKQKYIEKLKLEREQKVLKEKKIEKLKKIEIEKKKMEVEKQKQEIVRELERQSKKINDKLEDIFNNIYILEEYSKNIFKILKEYNRKSDISKYLIYCIKRILCKLPDDFKKEDLVKMEDKSNKISILLELGYNIEVDRTLFPRETQKTKNYLLLDIYNSAIDILYKTIIYNDMVKLKENKELYSMLISLQDNIDDNEYITNKIYSIYEKFYKKVLGTKIVKKEFEIITDMLVEERKYEKYQREFLLENNDIVDKISKVDEKTILRNITYIEKTDSFYNFYKRNTQTFSYLILAVFYNCTVKEKCIILENIQKIYNKLEKDLEKRELLKEKERLLKGDMSKEIELQRLNLDFSKIKNGYEFEEYVANLYRKLGYIIEEVTKKSGDQRCRRNSL